MQRVSTVWQENKGAILIEVLIAVVIMSVCLTVIIRSLISSLNGIVQSRDYSLAAVYLDNKMFDVLQRVPLGSLTEEEGQLEAPADRFGYILSVGDPGETLSEFYFTLVKMDVTWPSGRNTRKLSVTTYLPQKAPEEEQEGE